MSCAGGKESQVKLKVSKESQGHTLEGFFCPQQCRAPWPRDLRLLPRRLLQGAWRVQDVHRKQVRQTSECETTTSDADQLYAVQSLKKIIQLLITCHVRVSGGHPTWCCIPNACLGRSRYYHNPNRNVSVTFLQWFGKDAMPRGHLVVHKDMRGMQGMHQRSQLALLGCAPGQCRGPPWGWRLGVPKALLHHALPLGATHIFINAGLWGLEDSFPWESLASAGQIAMAAGVKVYWKTTTAQAPCGRPQAHTVGYEMPRALMAAGWLLFDAFRATCQQLSLRQPILQPDGRHLSGSAYGNLNMLLIQQVASDAATASRAAR